MFVGARGQIRVQRNDGRAVGGEVLGDGVFARKPFRALAGTFDVLHHARDKGRGEPQHQGAGVLENLAPVGCDSVGEQHLARGANRRGVHKITPEGARDVPRVNPRSAPSTRAQLADLDSRAGLPRISARIGLGNLRLGVME